MWWSIKKVQIRSVEVASNKRNTYFACLTSVYETSLTRFKCSIIKEEKGELDTKFVLCDEFSVDSQYYNDVFEDETLEPQTSHQKSI